MSVLSAGPEIESLEPLLELLRGKRAVVLAGGALTLIAALSLWWTPMWMALGFAAHGMWNLAHHTGAVKHGIRHWFPPMHAAWEWAVAALVVYFTW